MNSKTILLEPVENNRLAALCGGNDQHLRYIEEHINVKLNRRAASFLIEGILDDNPENIERASMVLEKLYRMSLKTEINDEVIFQTIQGMNQNALKNKTVTENISDQTEALFGFSTPRKEISAKTANQSHYLKEICEQTITFGIGPAGTGKTFLAVASAVRELTQGSVSRIVLTRPVIEAGEHLGYLPGDIGQKVDPYIRPLYDALNELLGAEKVAKLMEKNIIELAPLAYMRGRTLNDAFIILDEAQNTTTQQMKMFLTRIGFGSQAVITGDVTQVDLPKGMQSGLHHATKILTNVKGLSICWLTDSDIVRHPLVQRIVIAYEKSEIKRVKKDPA
ncbi:MAG: PhoH family protein [Arenicellaceae bacterium]|nr:PhoH family protein [Arenicellaceae bacterium]